MKLNKKIITRTTIFILSIFLVRLLIAFFIWPLLFYKKTVLPATFFPFTKTNLLVAGSFTLFAFLIYQRKELSALYVQKNNILHTILYSVVTGASIMLYYVARYYIKNNLNFFTGHKILAIILIMIPLVLFITSLFLAIFTYAFTKDLLKRFRKTIPLFVGVGILYYTASQYFQKLWPYFSAIVAKVAFLVFSLFYDTSLVFLKDKSPYLTIEYFKVIIGAPCSGIDSMLLFSTLYLLIFFMDFKKINKKRMLLLFIPGLVGIFFFNILRIFLLLLLGLYISKEFAVGLFHQNIGWLLFIIYFIIFYIATKKYLYKHGKKL